MDVKNHHRSLVLVATTLGVLAVAASFSLHGPASGQAQAAAQAQASQIPRLGKTKVPNMTGVWQALNEANWDLEAHPARAARTTHPGVPNGDPAHVPDPVPDAAELALGAT